MRFPTRRILVPITCFGIWVGMLVCGGYFLGSRGVMVNAVTIACACGLLFQMLNRWQEIAWAERSRYAIAVLVFFAAALTFQQFLLYQGYGLEQQVKRLNEKVQDLPEYSSVEFSLEKQGWVRASGLVASQRELDDLHALAYECSSKSGQIYWHVELKK